MKRLFLVVFILLICLCSCKTSSKTPIIIKGTTFDCRVQNGKEKYLISFSSDKNSDLITAEVISPKSLKGLKYIVKENIVSTEYKGLKLAKNIDASTNDIILCICRVLNDCEGKNAIETENNLEFSGEIGNKNYSVAISPSGLPLTLSIGSANKIYVNFENLTLVK